MIGRGRGRLGAGCGGNFEGGLPGSLCLGGSHDQVLMLVGPETRFS